MTTPHATEFQPVGYARKDPNDFSIAAQTQPVYSIEQLNALQARIDELMLEYCPDEMTPLQLEEWAKSQEVSPGPGPDLRKLGTGYGHE